MRATLASIATADKKLRQANNKCPINIFILTECDALSYNILENAHWIYDSMALIRSLNTMRNI